MNCIIEPHYLPCIQFFTKFFLYNTIYWPVEDIFIRQTYRSRCIIVGANGIMHLSLSVENAPTHPKIIDAKLNTQHNWPHVHWYSLRSCYGKAAFYEYYAPYFEKFYNEPKQSLLQYNFELTQLCMKLLKIPPEKLQLWYEKEFYGKNLHNNMHPKPQKNKPDPHFQPQKYMQVFSERHGFIANLSIVDLLFNEGPQAVNILKNSIVYK